MGIRTLYDPDSDLVALYDSVTMTALSCPLFHSIEMANEFPNWVKNNTGSDIRHLSGDMYLSQLYNKFHDLHVTCSYCGEITLRESTSTARLHNCLICTNCAKYDCED